MMLVVPYQDGKYHKTRTSNYVQTVFYLTKQRKFLPTGLEGKNSVLQNHCLNYGNYKSFASKAVGLPNDYYGFLFLFIHDAERYFFNYSIG